MEVTTSQAEKFVRVSGPKSDPTANWIMRESDIAGLTPEQIASKFALPAVPSQIGDVTIPAGTKLQASVANGILRGENPGGGDVDAARDVNITAGEQGLSIDTAAYARARSGLNSGSTEIKEQRSDTSALSSSFGGEQVNIRSGQNTTVQGSSVIGDAGVSVMAGGQQNGGADNAGGDSQQPEPRPQHAQGRRWGVCGGNPRTSQC